MSVIVNLASKTEGVLKNFLTSYFEKDLKIDNDVIEWVNVYTKPLDAIDLITAVIDNSERFNIRLLISLDAGILVDVNESNLNDLVKYMVYRFYKENNNYD